MIIVTGGTGFIGSNIIKALNQRNITNITLVDDLTDGIKFKNLGLQASVRIYNIAGQLVKTMSYKYPDDTEPLHWYGKNENGESVGSGLYIYCIDSNTGSKSGEIIIIK